MEWDPAQRTAKERYHFLTSAVAPRPIAWVTSVDPATGVVNAAPFSWFQTVCADPMLVMLSVGDRADGTPKDTARNAVAAREFVVNVVTAPLADAMVATSADYPPERSEVEALALATLPSRRVRPPRLAGSPVHLECRLAESRRYGRGTSAVTWLLGEVVHVHADDAALDARGNLRADTPLLGRLGGPEYVVVERTVRLERPRQADALRGP